jgi:BON domain
MRAALCLVIVSALFAAAPPVSDATIEAKIRAKFAKSKIHEENFRVSVKSGVATLEGATDVPQRKGVATRLAKAGGAREVVNKIVVGEAARRKMSERLQKARQNKKKPTPAAGATPPKAAEPGETPPADPPLKRMQIKR